MWHHQIGRGLGAEETLTELLNNNLVLIENLSMDHVTAFVALIRSKGKKPRYLDFLRALCSCRGAGVPVKQELICDIIFGDSSGHYTRVDSKLLGVTNVEAAGASIVMPVRCNAGQVMVRFRFPHHHHCSCSFLTRLSLRLRWSQPCG